MIKFRKNSVCLVPPGLAPKSAAMMCGGEVIRNVSILGRTQCAILNGEPVTPDETILWLNRLVYSPGQTTKLPESVDEFHAYYWLSVHNCVNESDKMVADGTPVNILGINSVTVSRGYIKNAIITD